MRPQSLLLFLLTACAPASPVVAPTQSPDPAASAAPAHAAPAASSPRDESAEDVATRLGAAWAPCDKNAALALCLSYDDMVDMTLKPIDKAEYDQDASEFIDERCRELAEVHARVVGAKLQKVTHHAQADDPERLKHDVDAAFVQLVLERDGAKEQRGIPLVFIHTKRGFRFAVKH